MHYFKSYLVSSIPLMRIHWNHSLSPPVTLVTS